MHHYLVAAALLLNAASLPAQGVIKEFSQLRQEAHAAREAHNKPQYLAAVLKLKTLLNDSPDTVEMAAKAYLALGDKQHALAALRKFADLGQVDEDVLSGKDKDFAELVPLPGYQAILKRLADNKGAVSNAAVGFTVSDANLLPEDIDYDPHSKAFLITSVLERKIVRVAMDGKAVDFAQSPSHWPMLAVKVDAKRGLVWATEVAMSGFDAAPKADWGRSAVLCFDLATGALKRRSEGPPKAALGDMALTQSGDPIVSDGGGGGVYRVVGSRLEPVNTTDFISPQTPAMLSDGIHVMVPDYARGIGILSLNDHKVTWLSGSKTALGGVDGLYYDGSKVILTQNGTAPERVVSIQLDMTLTHVLFEQIIERATSTLGDPTHGVIVGDWFYYIANSGWSELNEHGAVKAGAKLTPAHVMRYQIR